MQFAILLLITIALPISWFIAEFKASATVRRTLGAIAIAWSFGVASLVGGLQNFNANVYFTGATKELLKASIEQLQAGNTNVVLREWFHAEAQFRPTYENRARYKQIVEQAIEGMKKP